MSNYFADKKPLSYVTFSLLLKVPFIYASDRVCCMLSLDTLRVTLVVNENKRRG